MKSSSSTQRNLSPQFIVIKKLQRKKYKKNNKLIKPGWFSNQSQIYKHKNSNINLAEQNSSHPSSTPQQAQPQATIKLIGTTDERDQIQKMDIIKSQLFLSKPSNKNKKQDLLIKSQVLLASSPITKFKGEKLLTNSLKLNLENSKKYIDIQNSPQFGLTAEEEQLAEMVNLSGQLTRELENLEQFVSSNDVSHCLLQQWINDITQKLKIVQDNIWIIQQNIESKSSKESTASKEKSIEKEVVINEQQIEDYLEQISQAQQQGGAPDLIAALQKGILMKLQQELHDEKQERFKIEEEASSIISNQEHEIQRLEQRIRDLELGLVK